MQGTELQGKIAAVMDTPGDQVAAAKSLFEEILADVQK